MSLFYANTRVQESASSVPSTQQSVGCGTTNIFRSAVEYLGIIPKGNVGNAPEDGCAVDTQSRLMWGDVGTSREKGPKQTFARPWATTPNLGQGSVEAIDANNSVTFGHSTANRKSIQTVTDTQFPVFQPLIQQKESDIPAHNYFVEPFLRGGLSSRLIPKTRVDLSQ